MPVQTTSRVFKSGATRRIEPGSPVRVTYSLTVVGQELDPVLSELKSWARRGKKG